MATQPVSRPDRPLDPKSPYLRGKAPITLSFPRSGTSRDIPDIPTGEVVLLRGGAGPRPLGKQTTFALATDRLYVGTADSNVVEVFDLNGRPMSPVRLQVALRKATQRNLESAVEAIMDEVRGPFRDSVWSKLLSLPSPESVPLYSRILVDSEDWLWIVVSAAGDIETTLLAIDRNGRPQGEISLPGSFRVTDIGKGYILGLGQSDDGEPHVLLYRLNRHI